MHVSRFVIGLCGSWPSFHELIGLVGLIVANCVRANDNKVFLVENVNDKKNHACVHYAWHLICMDKLQNPLRDIPQDSP